MIELAIFAACCFGSLMLAASSFHALARMGGVGKRVCAAAATAPLLDIVVFVLTTGPEIAAIATWASRGEQTFGRLVLMLVAALLAQALTLVAWSRLHEALHPGVRKGPRIVSTLNRRVGAVRNNAAVWWTAMAVPVFNLIRIAEIVVYPPLTWLVRLPRYDSRDWVNVSRHKFSGLVGYDLIWCLYCDWMTGVWSLGSEMLRNVESFWCPIRFLSPEKCENCQVDFPDVNTHWIKPEQGMTAVTELLAEKYPGPGGDNSWLGHPARLTIEGREPRSK